MKKNEYYDFITNRCNYLKSNVTTSSNQDLIIDAFLDCENSRKFLFSNEDLVMYKEDLNSYFVSFFNNYCHENSLHAQIIDFISD